MSRFDSYVTVVFVVLALVVGGLFLVADSKRDNAPPDTDEAVGRCIQAQRVLYHVTRGEAAEKCLADLDRHGAGKFAKTWAGYETEEGLW